MLELKLLLSEPVVPAARESHRGDEKFAVSSCEDRKAGLG